MGRNAWSLEVRMVGRGCGCGRGVSRGGGGGGELRRWLSNAEGVEERRVCRTRERPRLILQLKGRSRSGTVDEMEVNEGRDARS